MISEVEGERGALPLLAFAVSRLWEKRDREQKLLTRQAYADIGGVGGALARHAEATIDRIGTDRIAVARELFRNLVTAEGTRAVREWNELLSIFSDSQSESAEEVLRQLIGARLLTSYEVRTDDENPTRSVEVVHESLLSSWPRLVRWQTQDADAAQLRDQLRQAARTWDEHGRSDDTLWTGSAYREFAVWRERYPGGLTELEEDFAASMTALAMRRRRRRRMAAASVLFLAIIMASAFGTLWRRSVQETRRAEAAKLLALAQVQLGTDPTEALAYATASLELADTREARIFAVRSLRAGPPLRALDLGDTAEGQFAVPTFSPDGRWLAVAGLVNENVLVYGEGGREPVVLGGHAVSASAPILCAWTRDNLLVTGHWTEVQARVWAMPEGRLIRTIEFGDPTWGWHVGDTHLLAEAAPQGRDDETGPTSLRSWRLPDGETEDLGTVNYPPGVSSSCFDRDGRAWIYAQDDSVYSRSLPVMAGDPDTFLASHSAEEAIVSDWRRPQGIYSSDSSGEIILWTSADATSAPGQRLRKPETATTRLKPDPAGRWAVDADGFIREGKASLWDLQGLAGARPIELRRSGSWYASFSDFHPGGKWVVATTHRLREVTFWPLQAPSPFVVDGYETRYVRAVAFTPDGRYLVTHWGQDRVRLWPLPGAGDGDVVDVKLLGTPWRYGLAVDPTGTNVLSTGYGRFIFLVSLTGAEPRRLEGFPSRDLVLSGAFSPSGRLVAAASTWAESPATLRVWDLSSGESRVFDQPQDPEAEFFIDSIAFVDETTLYTGGTYGLLRWGLETGTSERILEAPPGGSLHLCMASDRRTSLVSELGPAEDLVGAALYDLKTGDVRRLDIPEGRGWALALSPDGTTWATGEKHGSIWIGRTDGGEAHLVAGHEGPVDSVAISPDNRWIASSGEDKTLRLWPMPDLSKPPLHTLPHDQLIAKLQSLNNIRVVREDAPSTG
jgi:WD40 repeat protein